jgi:catechol 2,3-dioxygenase-like lactoylglutathione lyase family enzyme
MAEIEGIHHIALTVRDMEKSTYWYEDLFGLTKVMEMEEPPGRPVHLYLHPGSKLLFGFHTHGENKAEDFSEFHTGLDHIGFGVDSRAELEAWRLRIEERNIVHSPIAERPYGYVLVFRDPDNIQLELYAPPGPS